MRAEKDGAFSCNGGVAVEGSQHDRETLWWREAEARAPDGGDGRLLLQVVQAPALHSLSQS